MTEKTLADQEAEKQTQIGADPQEGRASTAAEVCTNEILFIGRSYGSFTLPKIGLEYGLELGFLSCTEIGSRDLSSTLWNVEYVLHSTMYPLGLESESESINKSVPVSVNEPMEVLY